MRLIDADAILKELDKMMRFARARSRFARGRGALENIMAVIQTDAEAAMLVQCIEIVKAQPVIKEHRKQGRSRR